MTEEKNPTEKERKTKETTPETESEELTQDAFNTLKAQNELLTQQVADLTKKFNELSSANIDLHKANIELAQKISVEKKPNEESKEDQFVEAVKHLFV